MRAGVALDVTGRWLVQLLHHNNIADFFRCPLKVESASPAVFLVDLQ
jgi:hypothetical protein